MGFINTIRRIHSPQATQTMDSHSRFLSTRLEHGGSLRELVALRQDGGVAPHQILSQAASNPSPIARSLLLLNDTTPDVVVAYHAKYDTSEIVKILAAAIIDKTPLGQVIDIPGISNRDRVELMFVLAIDGYHHLNEISDNSNKAYTELMAAQDNDLEIGKQVTQMKGATVAIDERKERLEHVIIELAQILNTWGSSSSLDSMADLTRAVQEVS